MGIGTTLATFKDIFGSMTSQSVASFSMLETIVPDAPSVIVGKDGSLMSILKIDGVKQVMGREEIDHAIDHLASKMAAYFSRPGHALQIWFSRDPDLAEEIVRQQLSPQRSIAGQIGIDLSDLFGERERHLPRFVLDERSYAVLWTRITALTKQEMQAAKLSQKAPSWWPSLADTQDMFRAVRPLKDRHLSLVSNFASDLRNVGIRTEVLQGHKAIAAVRSGLDPSMVGSDWRPTLPNDPVFPRQPERKDGDLSHFLWPTLDDQLFKRDAVRVNPRVVEMAGRYLAGLDMTVGPQNLEPFGVLVRRMMEINEFPWRISYLIESGGLDNLAFKKFIASVFTLTNSENRAIKNAITALQEAQSQEGLTVAKFRVSFCTWASVGEDGLGMVEQRLSRLQRAVESWGNCSVSTTAGDPLAGVMSSALGLQPASTAPAGAVPLDVAISMLPLDRDASPWNRGSIVFRTHDGRIWPYASGTNASDTSNDLIFGTPGKGKSVLMNAKMLARCLSATSTQGIGGLKLPRMSIIDIGPTSSGLISLIKEALPAGRRHEAVHLRMRNDPEHAINPFDTQLGARAPTPHERIFLVNFLTTLGTPVGSTTPPDSLADLAGFCIDELYEQASDRSSNSRPKRYSENFDRVVDEHLRRHAITTNSTTLWWNVVDALFERGDYHAAVLAQRHAVPRLEDIVAIMQSGRIKDVFGDAGSGNETLLKAFQRLVLASLKEYPVLSMPTVFDLGEARIVALDIEEVAPRGGGPADKQSALMYMLARYVLAKDYYIGKELLEKFESRSENEERIFPLYRDFHSRRITRSRESQKFFGYDEFHRTAGSTAVRQQAIVDMREGRKYNVHIALASQFLTDFDKEMINLASGCWILGVQTETAAREAKTAFGLSNTGYEIVLNNLTGPTSQGAPFLVVLNLKDGKHEHFLYNTLGPTEVWAFSTTPADSALRERLYEVLGAVETRRRLAIAYPTGSCKSEWDIRVERLAERGERDKAGVTEQMAQELIARNM